MTEDAKRDYRGVYFIAQCYLRALSVLAITSLTFPDGPGQGQEQQSRIHRNMLRRGLEILEVVCRPHLQQIQSPAPNCGLGELDGSLMVVKFTCSIASSAVGNGSMWHWNY